MIEKLKYFSIVARHGNISRAADEIHISQPALSAALRRLEKELDTDLFVRQSKGVRLTKVGSDILPYAEAIIENYSNIQKTVKLSKSGGVYLRIGGAMQHVSQIVDKYLAESGNTELFYRQYMNYYDIKSDLINHSVDIVVSSPPITGEDIESTTVYTEPLGVCLSEKNWLVSKDRISLAELQSQYLIGQPPNFPIAIAIARCMDELGISLKFSIEAENNAVFDLLRSEHATNYAAIYPQYRGMMISKEYPSIKWRPIDADGMVREIGISWRKGMTLKKPVRDFISRCEQFYRDEY